jgi:acyl-coenzyme A thioesterase PaaI-like protein
MRESYDRIGGTVPNAPQFFPTCFVCGTENPEGLQISFERRPEGGCRAEYLARATHVGWPEIIHGGVLFTLMDEAVAWAAIYGGRHAVTGKAEARFRAPARVGMRLVVSGWITTSSRRALRVHAEIREGGDSGPVISELDALMAVADIGAVAAETPDGHQA